MDLSSGLHSIDVTATTPDGLSVVVAGTLEITAEPNTFSVSEVGRSNTGASLEKVSTLESALMAESTLATALSKVSTFNLAEAALVAANANIGTTQIGTFAVGETGVAQIDAGLSKLVNFDLTEALEVTEALTVEAEKLVIGEQALSDTTAAIVKHGLFTVAVNTETRTQASLVSLYDPPELNLSPIDLTDMQSGRETSVALTLPQGGWRQVIFPIRIGSETVDDILDAKLSLFRGLTESLSLTLGNNLWFSNGELTAVFDETDTENLVASYRMELWIVNRKGNPIFVSGGTIRFEPTRLRF